MIHLRDGSQVEGATFSQYQKIHVAQMLDSFGVDYIEGGFAASNQRIWHFFRYKKGRFKNMQKFQRLEVPVVRE